MNAKNISAKFRVLLASACVAVSAQSLAEDAYLESDGTQYVVTGYRPTEKMKLVADFQIVTEKKSQSILGNRNNDGEGASFYVWMNGTPNLEGCFTSAADGDIWSGRLKTGIGANRYTVKVDYAAGSFVLLNPDGSYADPAQKEKKPAGERRTGVGTRPLSFFVSTPAKANADTAGAAMKLYSAQVYEEGVLIHDYVPCKKGERIGLYDTKTGEFWGSATRQPAIGGDYMTVQDDPYIASPKNNVASGAKAILDTRYKPNAKTRVELDYAQAADYTLEKGDWCYMMSSTSAGNDGGLFNLYQAKKNTIGVSMSMGKNSLGANTDQWVDLAKVGLPTTYSKDIRRTAILDNVNGKATLLTSGYETGSYTNKVHWYADRVHENTLKVGGFASNNGGYAPMKIYGLKIYEDDVLLHDYVPMKSGTQGVLKDKVTGRTLWTMNADSPFATSPNLAEEPYVESTGYQCVTLDYKPNSNTVLTVDYANLATNRSAYAFGTDGLMFWVNGNGNQEYFCHSAWSGGYPAGVDGKRHATVVDIPNSKIYYTDCTYRGNAAKDMTTRGGYSAVVAESAKPIALFNKNGVALKSGAKVRIYSANVYEDGVLVHSYQPFVTNGVVGFKDAKTGKFFSGVLKGEKVQANALVAGGAVANAGTKPEAYIESDQTQYLLTGYYPTVSTRLELDFQLTKLRNDFYLLGCNKTPNWEFYVNGNYGYTAICHTGWDAKTTDGEFADLQRTKIVLDRKRGKATISRAGQTWADYVTFGTASTEVSTVPLGLLARQEPNGTHYPLPTSATGGMVPMRVFSLRIYEDDVLVREYLPYKNGDVIGLKDTVTGNALTSAEGNPFVVGGMGYDGTKTFASPLEDASVLMDKTVTLSVFAPGAVRYEWTRGGVPLAETGDTATLGWQRIRDGGAQEISVTPVYSVYGREVKGTPSTATLTNVVPGLLLLVR